MKSTLPLLCAALAGTALFAQPSFAGPGSSHAREPSAARTREVYFTFDSAVMPRNEPDLASIATWAEAHPDGLIVLDGSTDSVGPADYNVRLAARRAEAVRARLIALGVDADRIVLAIYGEAAPRRGSNAADRRVTAWTTNDPIHRIVDRTLAYGTAVLWAKPVSYAELHPSRETVASR
jgi:outer membrane protein OmpA-like peptidoglycan-associated protein